MMLTALAASERPKLAVLDVQAVGVPNETAVALGEAITQDLTRRGFFEVVSSTDVRTLLGVERQKQLAGCSDDSSCTTELMGALGARFVLQAQVTKLGEALQLSMQMMDTTKSQAVARAVRLAKSPEMLAELLPWMLAEATATPLPPPPSRVLPITLIAIGAAAVVGGGVAGIDALSRDRALGAELASDSTRALNGRVYYLEEARFIGTEKTVSLVALVAGAALVTVGVVLMPSQKGTTVAMVPTIGGAAFAGVFP